MRRKLGPRGRRDELWSRDPGHLINPAAISMLVNAWSVLVVFQFAVIVGSSHMFRYAIWEQKHGNVERLCPWGNVWLAVNLFSYHSIAIDMALRPYSGLFLFTQSVPSQPGAICHSCKRTRQKRGVSAVIREVIQTSWRRWSGKTPSWATEFRLSKRLCRRLPWFLLLHSRWRPCDCDLRYWWSGSWWKESWLWL